MVRQAARVALVGVATLGGALLLRQAGVDVGSGLEGAAKAAWSGGVVHSRFVTSEGDVIAEEWVDLETGASRKVERGMGGARDFTVQSGMTIAHWTSNDPSRVYRMELVDRNDPWLEHSSQLLSVKRAIDAGRARVSGSATVGGRLAWEAKLSPGPDAPADLNVIAYLDQQTYELIGVAYTTGGVTRTLSVQSERLERSEALATVPDLFAVPDRWTLLNRRLDQRSLATAVAFTVYTLGPGYKGLRLSAPLLRLAKGGFDIPFEPTPHLAFGYAVRPYADPVIEFTQRSAAAEQSQRELAAFAREGDVLSVAVSGQRRDVHLFDAGRTPVYFALVVDGTLISGRADLSAAETLAMLASLAAMH